MQPLNKPSKKRTMGHSGQQKGQGSSFPPAMTPVKGATTRQRNKPPVEAEEPEKVIEDAPPPSTETDEVPQTNAPQTDSDK
jgi:hypothetical protein